jgi:hypothetical protein
MSPWFSQSNWKGALMDIPEGLPRGLFGVGASIDWNSEPTEIAFAVELPFWLLMPSCSFTVSHCGIEIPVAIENSGIEIQHGTQYLSTQRNTVFIGSETAAQKAKIPVLGLPGGGIIRATKTLLHFTAYALVDACRAFFEGEGPRFHDGYHYFASLANGHMPVVNTIVNAYRRASVDPYVSEVTKWDIPNWFVVLPPSKEEETAQSSVVCLYSGIVRDWYPTIKQRQNGDARPFYAASESIVLNQLKSGAFPGEADLLDGWSLFHSGRFADSIRSFVTAIEVLIESEVRKLLTKAGCNEHLIQSQLEKTRHNFDSRVAQYCELSTRRLPGPRVCGVPYLNGLRLHNELNVTRRLRHRIVHHGHRLNESYRGPMLRAAETTSWLFDWIALHSDFESRRAANSAFFFGGRISDTPFETDIIDGKIKVLPLFGTHDLTDEVTSVANDGVPVIQDFLRVVHTPAVLLNCIGKDDKFRDIEHFTRMAFYELGLGEIDDSPYPINDKCLQDRYVFANGDLSVCVYCFETTKRLEHADCQRIQEGIADQTAWGRRFDRVLVVFDDQFGQDAHCRDYTNRNSLNDFATDGNLSLINASELARLVLGVIDYGWCHETILSDLLRPGCANCIPPHGEAVGMTYRYWEQPTVIGIQLDEGVIVGKGDRLAILTKTYYQELVLDEFRIDERNRLTVVCNVRRELFYAGSGVFKLHNAKSYSDNYRYHEQAVGPFTSPKYRSEPEPTDDHDVVG